MALTAPDPCPPALRAMRDVLVEAVVAKLQAEARRDQAALARAGCPARLAESVEMALEHTPGKDQA